MIFFALNYNQLLMHGVHIGHSLSNTLWYSASMISAFRQSVAIINLFKSLTMFRISFLIISNITALHNPIWFINLDKATENYVRQAALSCGEFPVTSKWIRGTLSNYNIVFNAYKRLMRVPTIVLSAKSRGYSSFFDSWFLSRYSWPRLIFTSNINICYYPSMEAMALKIPSISIVDTDTWTQATSIPIPGNDESLGCLVFYNDIMAGFILSRKFNLLSLWFFNIRSISRIVDFVDWVSHRYNIKKNLNLNTLITFKANNINMYVKSLGLFLSNDKFLTLGDTRLDIFYKGRFEPDLPKIFPIFLNARTIIVKSLDFQFLKRVWSFKKFLRLDRFTDFHFKSQFLKKNYFYKNFLNKRYLKYILLPINLNIDFFIGITNLYFLQKYLEKLSLPKYGSPKLRYWNLISNAVVNRFSIKLKIFRDPKPVIKQTSINLNDINLEDTINEFDNKLTLLSKAVKFEDKLKFFISNSSFDSFIPKHLGYWNINYFSPKLNRLNPYLKRIFFKKNNKINYYFSGYLTHSINKKSFSNNKNIKWYWF